MHKLRRITPMCPKCNRYNTYDIIPELPNQPEIQLQADEFTADTYSVGNAIYYCMECNYKWKKYRGRKPYERIRVIYSETGGFPGPYSQVKVDLAKKRVEYHTDFPFNDRVPVNDINEIIEEDIELFQSELRKCDFVNWAEEYNVSGPVLDGGHWSVRIEYDTHCEIKVGRIHQPPKWTEYCKAISRLSGNEFY